MSDALVVDWGTTNLRAWRVDAAGAVRTAREFPLGVSKIAKGEAEQVFLRDVRPALGAQQLPALLCGMIGSDIGWRKAPYVDCPSGLEDIVGDLVTVVAAPVTRIVPGLRCIGLTSAPDVMRGEETQLIGWAELRGADARGRHLICHPGTHAKWALMEDGRIIQFVTAMTGELFNVLIKHSLLQENAAADDDEAFFEGLEAAGDGGALTSRLFSARTRVVAGGAAAHSTPSYLSGMLIGAEIVSMKSVFGVRGETPIGVLGAGTLRRHYVKALGYFGHTAWEMDGETAALAGMRALIRNGALDDA